MGVGPPRRLVGSSQAELVFVLQPAFSFEGLTGTEPSSKAWFLLAKPRGLSNSVALGLVGRRGGSSGSPAPY